MKDLYEDIINRPHHVSKARPQMSELERAAQFAPFAALTGYEDAIEETGRLTDEEILLDETAVDRINEQLQYLAAHMDEGIRVSVTYFRPDDRKSGGAYLCGGSEGCPSVAPAGRLLCPHLSLVWL